LKLFPWLPVVSYNQWRLMRTMGGYFSGVIMGAFGFGLKQFELFLKRSN